MKGVNLKSIFFMAAIALVSFSSCKKDNEGIIAPAPAPIAAGTWTGLYGGGNNEPSNYFSFVINANGTMIVKSATVNNLDPGPGTWTITDGIFKGGYNYDSDPAFKYNVSAKIDLVKNTIDGSDGFGETVADKDSCTMTG